MPTARAGASSRMVVAPAWLGPGWRRRKGDGYANLNNQQVKYTMYAIPKKSLAFSLGGQHYELKDKQIPTHINGTLSEPLVDNDIEDIFKQEFKQSELYQKTQAEEEKLKGKLHQEEDKLKDKLKGLFNK